MDVISLNLKWLVPSLYKNKQYKMNNGNKILVSTSKPTSLETSIFFLNSPYKDHVVASERAIQGIVPKLTIKFKIDIIIKDSEKIWILDNSSLKKI